MTFQVELVSPEAVTYQGEADMVIVRTVGGGAIAFQAVGIYRTRVPEDHSFPTFYGRKSFESGDTQRVSPYEMRLAVNVYSGSCESHCSHLQF